MGIDTPCDDDNIGRLRSGLMDKCERADLLRIIAQQYHRIMDLDHEVDQLRHRIKVLGFEISARSAATRAMDEYSCP